MRGGELQLAAGLRIRQPLPNLTQTQWGHMKTYCVYIHRKLSDGSIFYIGKGRGGKRARSKSARSQLWKRIEAKHGRTVEILLEGITNEQACELESFLIAEIGRDSLSNMTDGGEGTPGRFVSEKTRSIVSAKNKGRPPTREAIESALKKTRKPVVSLCGMRFKSISEAARFVQPESPHTAKISISSCCNGRQGQERAYGIEFRFEVDGRPYLGNHIKEKKVFNSSGFSFCSPKEAGEWCISRGFSTKASVAAGNIVSALKGRIKSAYGMSWWRDGQDPIDYISPSSRRISNMRASA